MMGAKTPKFERAKRALRNDLTGFIITDRPTRDRKDLDADRR
jgi:hypothetical protein